MKELAISTFSLVVLFLRTRERGTPGGDSGELLAESCQLGTAHPPGYPLFLMLSHLTMRCLQPLYSPADSVNIMCCFFGAMSCYFVGATVNTYFRGKGEKVEQAAAVAATLFGLSPLTWEYSTGAEVFALNNAIIAAMVYITALISTCPPHPRQMRRAAGLGAFICGLALCNQHTSLLFAIVLVPYVFWTLKRAKQLNGLVIAQLGLSFVCGLLPYGYLYWAGSTPKPGSWGDTSNLEGLVTHVLRSEYGTLKLAPGNDTVESALDRWRAYFMDVPNQLSIVGAFASLYGMVRSVEREVLSVCNFAAKSGVHSARQSPKRNLLALSLVLTLFFYLASWNGIFSNLPLSSPMAAAVHSRFWMQPNILLCFFSGLGFKYLLALVSDERRRCMFGRMLLLGLFLLGTKPKYHQLIDNSTPGIMQKYGEAMLKTIPEGALLVSHTDLDWNTVRYLTTCEGRGSTLTHVNAQLLPYPWFQRQIRSGLYHGAVFPAILKGVSTNRQYEGNALLVTRFVAANIARYPGGVFIDMQSVSERDIGPGGQYRQFTLVPWGLVYRVFPQLNSTQIEEMQIKSLGMVEKVESMMKPYVSLSYSEGSWEFAACSVYWDMHYQLGLQLLSFALSIASDLSSKPSLFLSYLKALNRASKLLWKTNLAVKSRGTLSYSESDALKNGALSFMRLLDAVQISKTLGGGMPDLPLVSDAQLIGIQNKTYYIITNFLERSPHDKDANTFREFVAARFPEGSQGLTVSPKMNRLEGRAEL